MGTVYEEDLTRKGSVDRPVGMLTGGETRLQLRSLLGTTVERGKHAQIKNNVSSDGL